MTTTVAKRRVIRLTTRARYIIMEGRVPRYSLSETIETTRIFMSAKRAMAELEATWNAGRADEFELTSELWSMQGDLWPAHCTHRRESGLLRSEDGILLGFADHADPEGKLPQSHERVLEKSENSEIVCNKG